MDIKLERVPLPVSDVDRAKAFYVDQVGFNPDHDHRVTDEIRFVQLTPPGSACSIAIGTGLTDAEPGSTRSTDLVGSVRATLPDGFLVGGVDPSLADTHQFYEGAGCIECGGTGFKGRTAICELLDLSDNIREMILERRPSSEIKKAAREEGMRFLRESAVERVLKGITTLREINKVTFVE